MNRRILIGVLGLVVLGGLYLWDRDNSTQTLLAAKVISVEDRDEAAGPDSWHMTVDIAGTPIELAPLQSRPDLAPGDMLCVTRVQRPGQPDVLRRANAGESC